MTNKSYGTTNVQVIAPSTLSAGYTFDATYNGTTFQVTVPEGGVVKGQRFIVPFAPVAEALPASAEIPTGVWRDGLCDCMAYGPCHPHFLNAWFCRPILIGQLLTRMKMTWSGRRDYEFERNANDSHDLVRESWRDSFKNLVGLTIAFYVLMAVTTTPQTVDPTMSSSLDEVDEKHPEYITYNDLSEVDKIKYTLNGWISTLFSFYILYILVKLRATMRKTYSIPEESCLCLYQTRVCGNNPRDGIECCGRSVGSIDGSSIPIGWEDVCCSLWCPVCTTAQMARHTVNYGDMRGTCCNEVGVYGWDDDDAYSRLEGGVGEGAVLVV